MVSRMRPLIVSTEPFAMRLELGGTLGSGMTITLKKQRQARTRSEGNSKMMRVFKHIPYEE